MDLPPARHFNRIFWLPSKHGKGMHLPCRDAACLVSKWWPADPVEVPPAAAKTCCRNQWVDFSWENLSRKPSIFPWRSWDWRWYPSGKTNQLKKRKCNQRNYQLNMFCICEDPISVQYRLANLILDEQLQKSKIQAWTREINWKYWRITIKRRACT